jgi:hypothetical protein
MKEVDLTTIISIEDMPINFVYAPAKDSSLVRRAMQSPAKDQLTFVVVALADFPNRSKDVAKQVKMIRKYLTKGCSKRVSNRMLTNLNTLIYLYPPNVKIDRPVYEEGVRLSLTSNLPWNPPVGLDRGLL